MIEYREARGTDVEFVVDTWMKSYRTCYSAGIVTMPDWYSVMDGQIRKILARDGVSLIVAHNPKLDASTRADVHGWIATERGFLTPRRVLVKGRYVDRLEPDDTPLVHYVYVKSAFRCHGIATSLFKAADIDPLHPFYYTCRTTIVRKVARKIPGGDWNPLIARYPKKKAKAENDNEVSPHQVSEV